MDLPGIPVTLDAVHTSRETLLALQEQPGADTLATIQGHAGLADDLIAQDGNWAGPEARRAAERWTPGHGRWERRELVTTAAVRDDWLPWPGGRQVFRVTLRIQRTRQGKVTTEVLDRFPSLRPEQAAPWRLPWHQGHGTVANRNPLPRDVSLGEDASPSRTRHGPANHAALHNLVLAWLVRSGRGSTVPLAQSPCSVRRDEALEALPAKQAAPWPARRTGGGTRRSRGAPAGPETGPRGPAPAGELPRGTGLGRGPPVSPRGPRAPPPSGLAPNQPHPIKRIHRGQRPRPENR